MQETASLQFVGHNVHLTLGDVSLRPGIGVHELQISLSTLAQWLPSEGGVGNARHLLLGARLYLGDALQPVAHVAPAVVQVYGFHAHEVLAVLVSDQQLIGIEEARRAGAVRLRIDLYGTLLDEAETGVSHQQTQVGYQIDAVRWVELLDQGGLGVAITLRVPTPLAGASVDAPVVAQAEQAATFRRAGSRLREARDALADGRYEECVRNCRLVMEILDRIMAPPTAKAVAAVVPNQRDESLRWGNLHHALFSIASAATHDDDVTGPFTWRRGDAQAILNATAGLLYRALERR